MLQHLVVSLDPVAATSDDPDIPSDCPHIKCTSHAFPPAKRLDERVLETIASNRYRCPHSEAVTRVSLRVDSRCLQCRPDAIHKSLS